MARQGHSSTSESVSAGEENVSTAADATGSDSLAAALALIPTAASTNVSSALQNSSDGSPGRHVADRITNAGGTVLPVPQEGSHDLPTSRTAPAVQSLLPPAPSVSKTDGTAAQVAEVSEPVPLK